MQVFALLHGVYFIMHYFFACSPRTGALYPAFLSMMRASAPPMLTALTLGFNTNLFGGLTHYASGQARLLLQRARADVAAVEAGRVHVGGEPAHLQHGGHGVVMLGLW